MNFSLNQIPLRLFLGVPDEERSETQEVLVTVSFSIEVGRAQFSDDLNDSLDYSQVYELVTSFGSRHEPIRLLEVLHRVLLEELKEAFPDMQNIEISIEKFPFQQGSITIKS